MGPRHEGLENRSLHAGSLLHRRVLSHDAIYRVLREPRGSVVEVQVIVAPGLEPGTRLTLTSAAASAMRVAPSASTDSARAGRRGILHNLSPVPPSMSKLPGSLLRGRLRPRPGSES